MRNMGGLKQWMPVTYRVMAVGWLAIAGIPPLAGFFSKDEILAVAFARGHEAPVWYLVWFLGAAAALVTAFYMTRLMLYTFEGPNRTGQAEQAHLHEAPKVMTVPLVALAALTVLGGLVNLPAFLPGAGWLHHWIEPVTRSSDIVTGGAPHLSHATEYALIALAVGIAVAGIWLARTRLDPAALVPADRAPAETGFQRLLAEAYRVDALYDRFVVRPIVWFSRNVLWKGLDAGVVDGAMVNGSAFVARSLGWLGTRLQTGQVGTYIVIFVIGALALLGALTR
jgi:NADH-quinone oxidoreductase subunit L